MLGFRAEGFRVELLGFGRGLEGTGLVPEPAPAASPWHVRRLVSRVLLFTL